MTGGFGASRCGESGDFVEMDIATEHTELVLACDGSDPEIVHGNGCACGFELPTNYGIVTRGIAIGRKDGRGGERLLKPVGHALAEAGFENAKAKLGQGWHGDAEAIGLGEVMDESRFIQPPSGQAVGVDDHGQSSGSIWPKCSATTCSMSLSSATISGSLAAIPANFNHGLPAAGGLLASLSWMAWEM